MKKGQNEEVAVAEEVKDMEATAPEVDLEAGDDEVEGKVKKEKTAKKIKKLAARTAQLITYIQENQVEGKNSAELIFEGIFTIFGGFEEIPNYTSVLNMVAKYQEEPDKAKKILAPLSPEKKAIRKQKRAERLARKAKA